jgi:hypothetical protein
MFECPSHRPGQIYVIREKNEAKVVRALAKGQIWKLNHVYIQIVELGKTLLHYRMLDSLGQRGVRTQISGIDTMWSYLRTRHAQLIRSEASLEDA